AAFDRRVVSASFVREHTRMKKSEVLVSSANAETLSTAIASNVEVVPADLAGHKSISLGKGKLDPELVLGRALFHRTDHTGISTVALGCISCHPDGREDGLVWRVKGTRRQTPMLAGRLRETAPYNWAGTTKTLEENITQTIERLGGEG